MEVGYVIVEPTSVCKGKFGIHMVLLVLIAIFDSDSTDQSRIVGEILLEDQTEVEDELCLLLSFHLFYITAERPLMLQASRMASGRKRLT